MTCFSRRRPPPSWPHAPCRAGSLALGWCTQHRPAAAAPAPAATTGRRAPARRPRPQPTPPTARRRGPRARVEEVLRGNLPVTSTSTILAACAMPGRLSGSGLVHLTPTRSSCTGCATGARRDDGLTSSCSPPTARASCGGECQRRAGAAVKPS